MGWYALAIVAAIWGESDFLLAKYLKFRGVGDEAMRTQGAAQACAVLWQFVAIFGLLMGAKIL